MTTTIPVTVVTGPFGSGKTTLLNRLLQSGTQKGGVGADHADIVVVACEAGLVPVSHVRVVQVTGNTALVPSACPCCAVQGELVDALRHLFLQALHRKIPPFSRILVETAGAADPAAVMYTLKYDRFLAERYAYQGCIAVLDGRQGDGPLHDPEVQRQAALADVVVISKADSATPRQINDVRAAAHALNPATACLASTDVDDLAELLEAGTFKPHTGRASSESLWSGRKMGRQQTAQFDLAVLTLAWRTPLRRSAFARVVDRLQSSSGPVMLRIQGRVWFEGSDVASLINGVHQQVYVMDEAAPIGASAITGGKQSVQSAGALDCSSMLTLVFRGAEHAGLRDELLALMPGGQSILSPGRNFIHSGIALRAT